MSSGPLRVSFIVTNSLALVALIVSAATARLGLPLTAWYALKAAAIFVTIVIVAVPSVGTHHPYTRLGLANQTTTLRAVLVSLLAGLIGEPGSEPVAAAAAGGTLAVTLLDGVDGWLARRGGMSSRFGARFDMEVDALLIMVLSVLVWQYGKAGMWVLLSGLVRYVFVAAGWLLPWLNRPLQPSRRRQAICVVQVGGLNLAIVPAIPAVASAALAALALAALTYSFLVDVVWLWRQPRSS